MDALPSHLRKYITEQNYEKYTPVDHSVWRYILRQLKIFLSEHAHDSYNEGLEKTGIEIERIPKISDISEKLSKFGWRALPVSGFIPPAAFMELQSLGVLPIASDLRSLDHLLYTPAPDIVHEAAGHAPILVHPEFAAYLKQYAQIARKAIISKEDLNLYEAIRELSDIKESPHSTPEQIKKAEGQLDRVSKSISHVSEAAMLGRMNWWTAEYGLIGDLKSPRIFGAGLLSSVGESRWCLSEKVKKIPLTVKCVEQTYDITEPQPQLFVTPDFKTLNRVLEEFADQMAFRRGGMESLKKLIQSQTVNTVELNSGLQLSGELSEVLSTPTEPLAYLNFKGPSQLSFQSHQLAGHGRDYHSQGYGTPLGYLKQFPKTSPCDFSDEQWQSLGCALGQTVVLEFVSGVKVKGQYLGRMVKNGKTLLLALKQAQATYQDRILFDPSWGNYEIALGTEVPSAFGGPADREAFGELQDFVVKRVPPPKFTPEQLTLHQQYKEVRFLRENGVSGAVLEQSLTDRLRIHDAQFAGDWLLRVEMYELALMRIPQSSLVLKLKDQLEAYKKSNPQLITLIEDGLRAAKSLH